MYKYFIAFVSFVFISCASSKPITSIMEKVVDQSICQKQEECVIKMVESFNVKDLKNQSDIKEASCKILAFACTTKSSAVLLQIHLKGIVQGQCVDSSITVEGGIEYSTEKDTCTIKVKSTTYESLLECNNEKSTIRL